MRLPSQSGSHRSAAVKDPRSSAWFSAQNNPRRIAANTPPVVSGLRPCIRPQAFKLAAKMSPPDFPMTTYRDAGVDIDAGDEFVDRIKPLVRSTFRPEVLTDLGGFGGLFRLQANSMTIQCSYPAPTASAPSSRLRSSWIGTIPSASISWRCASMISP